MTRVFNFVTSKGFGGVSWAFLKDQDIEPGLAEGQGQWAASSTASNDDNIFDSVLHEISPGCVG